MKRGITGWAVCALGGIMLPASVSAGTVADAKAAAVGSQVTITATISNVTDLISSGSSKSFQIQDSTGGITVFGTNAVIDGLLAAHGGLSAGDTITITGATACFNGLLELVAPLSVGSKDASPGVPLSKLVTLADLANGSTTAEGFESELVTLQNVRFVNSSGSFAASTNYIVSADGTNTEPTAVVRIATGQLNLVGQPIPTGPVDITGMLGQYVNGGNCTSSNTGYQLQPRSTLDILTPGSLAAVGTVTPDPVFSGGTVSLTVQLVPATDPPSTGITVNADLSAIGGPNPAALTETLPGSSVYAYTMGLACSAVQGTFSLPVSVVDAQARSANLVIPLTVQDGAPAITVQPSNNTVCAGGTAQFTVVATGSGLSYRWYNAAGQLSDGGNISGATEASVQISGVSQADVDAGPYYVIVTGTCPLSGDPPVYNVTSNTAALTLGTPVTPEQKQVVISQVYGGGGNSGAYWTNDFIELFNRGTTPVVLDGWSVQYASSDLVSGGSPSFEAPPRITTILTGTIQPGHYFLIQESQGAGGTHALPQPPDFDGTTQNNGIAISAVGGKVALVNNSSPLSGACPLSNCGVVDFLGWDALYTTCYEGSGAAPYTGNTSAVFRKSACTDSDDNAADFTWGTILEGSAARPHTSADTAVPVIVTQPVDQRVCENQTAAFAVTADGPCLSYQWQINTGGGWGNVTTGTGGDTRSYTTEAITPSDVGTQYRVVVSNPFGTPATSEAATVAIEVVTSSDRQVVINQVYGGGGNTNAVYQNDFIELYNRGSTPVDVTGWSVQYASAAGSSWNNKTDLSGVILPGHYYLIKEAAGNSCDSLPCGAPLPGTPDLTGTINLSGTSGKVILFKSTVALDGVACPEGDCHLVDMVGYGTATCFEGSNPAPAASVTQSIVRRPVGVDTDENGVDFVLSDPMPAHNAPGDFDGSGNVDSVDAGLFRDCVTGPEVHTIAAGCSDRDLDADGDVDSTDFGLFQKCYTGPEPVDPGCLSGG